MGLSLTTSRARFGQRAVIIGHDRASLLAALDGYLTGQPTPDAIEGTARDNPKVAFLFSGQGGQRPGMGRELSTAHSAFAEALGQVCDALDAYLDRPLRNVMFAPPGTPEALLLNETGYTQPALFAYEVAAFALLESLGIKPDQVAGHSVGEYAAAHLAGVWSVADAARLITARGRLMQALDAPGAMVAIEATPDEMAPALAGLEHLVGIAAINGPASLVISGAEETCLAVAGRWREAGRRTHRLPVSHAFHSPLMEPMLAEFAAELKAAVFMTPRIPFATNLAGSARDLSWGDPDYWLEQIRRPVQFHETIQRIEARGVSTYLEVGPDAVLSAAAQECVSTRDVSVMALHHGRRSEPDALVACLAQAWAAGVPVDWAALSGAGTDIGPDLPVYAFDRDRFWLYPPSGAADVSAVGLRGVDHLMLGAAVEIGDGGGAAFTGRLSLADFPWLADHRVAGATVVPGTAVLDVVLEAGTQVGCGAVEELMFEAPLVLPAEGDLFLQVVVEPGDEGAPRAVQVYSRPDGGAWARCASGVVVAGGQGRTCDWAAAWPPPDASAIDVPGGYARLADVGHEYGPAFRGVSAAWSRGQELFAQVIAPADVDVQGFGLHPALLDSAFHPLLLTAEAGDLRLPFVFKGARLCASGAAELRVRLARAGDDVTVETADASGALVLGIDSLRVRTVSAAALASAGGRAGPVSFGMDWVDITAAVRAEESRWACVGGPAAGLAAFADLPALAAAAAGGLPVPELVAAPCLSPGTSVADGVREMSGRVLELVRTWLGDERFATSRLVFVTHGAIGADVADLVGASVWGLVRSAQSEHPGRFVLADVPAASTTGPRSPERWPPMSNSSGCVTARYWSPGWPGGRRRNRQLRWTSRPGRCW